MRHSLVVLFLAVFFTGCGLKGPLYHPESKPAPKTVKQPVKPPGPAPIEMDTQEAIP